MTSLINRSKEAGQTVQEAFLVLPNLALKLSGEAVVNTKAFVIAFTNVGLLFVFITTLISFQKNILNALYFHMPYIPLTNQVLVFLGLFHKTDIYMWSMKARTHAISLSFQTITRVLVLLICHQPPTHFVNCELRNSKKVHQISKILKKFLNSLLTEGLN